MDICLDCGLDLDSLGRYKDYAHYRKDEPVELGFFRRICFEEIMPVQDMFRCGQCLLIFEPINLPTECPVCGLPDVHKIATYPVIERRLVEIEETED